MKVKLAHASNPDIAGGYWSGKPDIARSRWIQVKDFEEAVKICREFIDTYRLGGGNWTGGQLKEGSKAIGTVGYNGRIWKCASMKDWTPDTGEIQP